MKKEPKPETRGRKPKIHAPINASFDEVLKVVGKSKYKDEKAIKKSKKK
jgi:hypothetical protein